MKTSRILLPFAGALAGFGGTLLLLRFMGKPGYEWVAIILKPGFFAAELAGNTSNSISIAVIAGFLTMTLIGALIGLVIDLFVAPSK